MRITRRAACAMGVLAAALAAASPVHAQPMRDSAGVRIIAVNLTRPAGTLRLSPKPMVDVGGGAAERKQLFRVRAVARLSRGGIVIANGGSAQLKLFDASGRFVREVGGRGQGPGEFESMGGVWILPGDTILVTDGRLRRLVFFDSALKHVRTVRMITPQDRRDPGVVDLGAGRTLLATSSNVMTTPPSAEPYYFTQDLYIYDLDGKAARRIGTFGASEHFAQTTKPENGGVAYWDRTFGRRTTIRATGNEIVIGDGTTWELRRFSQSGALNTILRSTQAPPAVTRADRAAVRAADLEGVKTEDRAVEERRLDEMPYPERFPAFQRFETDPVGRTWVKRYPKPGDRAESWSVISADGRYLAEITLPPRVHLRSVGVNWVACTATDADDVERVQLYAIVTTVR